MREVHPRPAPSCSPKGQPPSDAVTSGLTRIPDSSRTSRRVGNVPQAAIPIAQSLWRLNGWPGGHIRKLAAR